MKNLTFTFWSILFCLAIGSGVAENSEQKELRITIGGIIFGDEFKAEQKKELELLPIESVEVLTTMINEIPINDPSHREPSVFSALVSKFGQFEATLPDRVRESAILALEAHSKDTLDSEQRLKIIDQLRTKATQWPKGTKGENKASSTSSTHEASSPDKTSDAVLHQRSFSLLEKVTVCVLLVAASIFYIRTKRRKHR